jgi:hypothetical protein
MFEHLDAIDWATLSHAYGSAEDVPTLIRNLSAPDPDTRDRALSDLFSTIWHQGTVYSASAPAVPFLIALAAHPDTPDRPGILYLLQALADGASYIDAHGSVVYDSMARLCAERGSDLETERQRECGWVRAVHAAVSAGLPVYYDLLADGDAEVRSYTLYLLAALPEHAPEITAVLRPMLVEEREPLVALSLAVALLALAGTSEPDIAVFEHVLCESDDPVVRLVAAAALVGRLGDGAPTATIDLLVEATRRMETDAARFERLAQRTWSIVNGYLPEPWGLSLLDLAIDAFGRLSFEQHAPRLIRALDHASAADVTHQLAKALLDRVFDTPADDWLGSSYGRGHDGRPRISYHFREHVPPRAARELTAIQREIISAIGRCDSFWQIDTNLLARYGLPGEQALLRPWLRQTGVVGR